VIQPSYTEGYSKVPVEALFHGAIPILSDVSTNSEIVGYGSRGRYFSIDHVQSIADHISDLSYHPSDMIQMIENGRVYARTVTLEAWQQHLHWMLTEHWKINLPKPRLVNSDIFI
jgi:glycosyltransferase involved in cell wall biosynthesis